MIHHFTRATRHLIFWGLMTLALGVTAIRITLNFVDNYKAFLETAINRELSAPVAIDHLAGGMRGFRPELVLKNVTLQSPDKSQNSALKIAEVRLSVNLLNGLNRRQLLASSWITLVGAKITLIHQPDGRISVLGLATDPDQPPPAWLLKTTQIEILQSRIRLVEPKDQTQLFFEEVDVSLKNSSDGQQHWLNLLSIPPKQYAEMLRISMRLEGNFFDPDGLNGLIYADIKNLLLDNPSTKKLPDDLVISGGQGDLKLWGQWHQSQLKAITGMMQFHQIQLQRQAQPPLLISQLLNHFQWTQDQENWELAIDHLTLKSYSTQLADARLSARGRLNRNGANADYKELLDQLDVQANTIDLRQATRLSSFFSPANSSLSALKTLQGQLKNFRLTAQPETQQFALTSDFEQVGVEANPVLPGITNLSGHLHGNQQSGSIDLNARDSSLELPEVFTQPLPLDTLKAHFTWQQTPKEWQIESPSVALTIPDIAANSRLKLNIDRETSGVTIDLTSAFSGTSEINTFAKYLPLGIMGKDAANWLSQAFLKGRVKPRGAILQGKLADFPFQQQQGVFQISLDLIDTDLHYAPDWDPLLGLDAEVLFYQEGMQVIAQKVSAGEFKFSQLSMQLKSFELSDNLTISGEGNGDMTQILGYLQHSPLKQKLADLSEVINPEGPTGLKLNLLIPLIDQDKFKLNGTARLQDVHFNVLPVDLPVTHTRGNLDFNEAGLTFGALQAQTLGNAISGKLKGDTGKIQIDVHGHTHLTDLQKQLKQPLWNYAQGETDYLLKLNLPGAINQHPQLHLSSDLKGIALNLPDILAKPAEQTRSFDLHINLNDQAGIPLTLNYAEQLKAAFNLDLKQRKIRSGEVLLGEGQLGAAKTQGIYLNINLNRFSPAEWLALGDSDETADSKPLFDQIKLRTEHLLWQQQDTGSTQLSMQQKQQAWQIDVDNPLLKGHIVKPFNAEGDVPVILNLDYLDLSGLSKIKTSKSEQSSSKRLPLFNINSEQVFWDKLDLGKLSLETRRITNGIEFKNLTLKNPHGLLELSGNWIFNATEELTTALGKLTMRHFGDFINQLEITDDLKDTQALIEFAVNWSGSPQQFALERLDGRVDIELKNGRILSIEPGFGRVLGFLAMEQWGRRLRLDFSDMISQGLTFNSILGHFDLHQGNAVTDRLKIDAIPANIDISGSAYLPEHSLNYHVTVLPKSSAAVPIAGTIVDKVLTFAVETLTGTDQEGFLLGSEYKLRGTWQNPEVIQLHENDGLLPKTWSGLTDFPWITDTQKNNH